MVESVAADLQDHPLLAVEKGAVDEWLIRKSGRTISSLERPMKCNILIILNSQLIKCFPQLSTESFTSRISSPEPRMDKPCRWRRYHEEKI